MSPRTVALFPLNTVLFPEGPLPLRIFEPRYLELVSHCMRTGDCFGVCLIESGKEVGEAPKPHEVGTLARIVDWHRLPDGLLGITALGETRFRIVAHRVLPSQLVEAEVEALPAETTVPLPDDFIPLADFLRQLIKHVPHLFEGQTLKYGDAGWVAGRLTELLPFPLDHKQALLELDDPLRRLERVRALMGAMNVRL